MPRPMRTIPTRSQPTNPTEMIFSKLIGYSLSDVQNLPVRPLDTHQKQGPCRISQGHAVTQSQRDHGIVQV